MTKIWFKNMTKTVLTLLRHAQMDQLFNKYQKSTVIDPFYQNRRKKIF